MDFYEVLDQVIDLLRSRGRVSYRALKVQFQLDDESLEALKDELIKAQRFAVDEDGSVLVWIGTDQTTQKSASQPTQTSEQPITTQDQPTPIEPPPTESHTPDAERRHLTVMFSDLVDSTRLSGQLDPEDYREVLRSYQSTCSEVIQRFDGYIAQHLGDALLVYFGYPQAHEDEGQRAVRAGLGMLEAMKTLNARLEQDKGIRLSIRVGVHTGLTVISDVGSGQKHEMLALGEAPNVASRIQGLAKPDTIAMSADTYRLIEGYFTVEDLGAHTLKGVAEPMRVYRVVGESGAQSRLEIAATRGLTPLVGREQEVGLLLERWSQVQSGQGQVVLLSGEGGIGKSRLVQVLKEHVADEPHTRWECRSSPYFQNSALYPITDLFQRTLQFQADDTPEQRLEKLERELRQYRLPLEESVLLFAPLLSLPVPEERYPPLAFSPQRQRQKTLESIVAILLEQAEQQPVLFILEDLHWTDPTTLEFLGLLLDQTPTTSIGTILTCRPEFEPPWGLRTHLTPIALNHLTRTQIETMAQRITDGKSLPAVVLQQIIAKTDGVPLFVEEMTKAVLESGMVQEVNGQYEVTGALSSLAIPATLQDSLMARLDRLVTAKGIAQMGATIGRQFSYELLHAMAHVDETTLQRELHRLVEAELIHQRGIPPQVTYMFKHALVQDAAYQSLLKSTRQHYHRQIAQALEEQFPETAETQPELLAHHFTEAGLIEQAIWYWHKAGEKAVQRSANAEAINHLKKGLEVLKTLPDTPERMQRELTLHIALGAPLIATKGFAAPEVGQAYTRARALCRQIGETPQLFHTLFGLTLYYLMRIELQTAQELGEQCLRLAQRGQESEILLQAHHALWPVMLWRGDFVSARQHVERGMALYDTTQHHAHTALYGGHDPGACSRQFAALILWILGYPDQALAKSRSVLTLTQDLAHPLSKVLAHNFAAVLHELRRESHAAKEQAETTMRLCAEQGLPLWLAWGTIIRGKTLTELGQDEEGVTQMCQGLEAWRATGATTHTHFVAMLAEGYRKVGQSEEGLTLLAEALAHMNQTEERQHEAELHRLQGELLLQQSPDNPLEAETCFQKALDVARNQQAKSWELRAATSLARLWQQQGKREEARQVLSEIYGWFTEGFDTADLKDARALLEELA